MITAGAHFHSLAALAAHSAAWWPLLVAVPGVAGALAVMRRRRATHFHD